jgi:hypothetical protein
LADQYAMNALRVQRLQNDLATILRVACRSGIRIMPLKGSLLSVQWYSKPALRPMADIDLLIPPEDELAMVQMLESLDYRIQPTVAQRPVVRKFLPVDGHRIAPIAGEHPENPRPVEVHIRLKYGLWEDVGVFDPTDHLWADSRKTEFLGETVWVPAPDRLLFYLSGHALHHFLYQQGRYMHMLDLALVAAEVEQLDPPDPNWIYPSLRLTARVLPSRFNASSLPDLAGGTDARLRRWAESVPLDGRCGLSINATPPAHRNAWKERWIRWHPTSARLALAYGSVHTMWALGQHLATIVRYVGRKRLRQKTAG